MNAIHKLETLEDLLLRMTSHFAAMAIPGNHLDLSRIVEILETPGSGIVCLETTQAVFESAEKSDDFVFRYGSFLFIWANENSTHIFWLDEFSNQYFVRRLESSEAHMLGTLVASVVHELADLDESATQKQSGEARK